MKTSHEATADLATIQDFRQRLLGQLKRLQDILTLPDIDHDSHTTATQALNRVQACLGRLDETERLVMTHVNWRSLA